MSLDPALLAEVHATSFDAPWDVDAFADLLAQPGVLALGEAEGFILVREAAGEAEILTLAVRPEARRRGYGQRLVAAAVQALIELQADRLFLEVAEDNAAARALYARCDFVEVGRRPRYYARANGPAADALILALNLRPLRLP